jgi:single-stranded DNA-binding protein
MGYSPEQAEAIDDVMEASASKALREGRTDLNLVVIEGRLAVAPELRQMDSGDKLIRYLVTVSAETPRRRVDVLPVTLWDPGDLWDAPGVQGQRVWITGSVQRRFWESNDGRRSRIEIVAEQVVLREDEI